MSTPDALFESLESRCLLSAEMVGSDLVIVGTNGADDIVVQTAHQNGVVTVSGVDGVEDGTTFSGVDSVRIKLRRGNDQAEIVGSLRDTSGDRMVVRMFGGYGWDTLIGSDTTDLLRGGPGKDVINGKMGDDILVGGYQQDTIYGGAGDDTATGNLGFDVVFGGPGDDLLYGGTGNDVVHGGPGDDLISGQLGRDSLYGGTGNDGLFGGGDADKLRGNSGADVLIGGAGDDDLYGGFGGDELIGSLGEDYFRGHFIERQDFGGADAFFNADLAEQAEGQLNDAYWNAIDELDAQGALTEDMWIVINGSQTLLSECAPLLEDAEQAFSSLNEFELQQIAIEAIPILEDFFVLAAGDLDGDSMDAILALLDQFIDILPTDVQQPLDAVFACLQDNDELLTQMAEAIERIEADGEVPPALMEGYGAVAIGAFGAF